ncbi:hypothetical protein BDN67DRAFT_992894 [Paxillus ammoniavirescens]|nr:hypothetical protein BDN67DRAFT_992894 [Paxillus ammoniavirescens]
MVYRNISRDVKLAAIRLHEHDLLELPDILNVCGFLQRTFYCILKLWCETGRPRVFNHEDVDYLIQLIRQKPEYFLDELLRLLRTNHFISVHYSVLHDELERAGMNRKKLRKIAIERNEDLHAEFIARMAQYDPVNLGFIDEVSKNERTLSHHYGRIIAGTAVEGSMTRDMFMEWLEFEVAITKVRSISWPPQCPCDGQCKDPSW